MKKKVHLVLGSGGARGIAHIAVIEELEKAGYEIIEVIGCSMGAVVGGIFAAGHLPEYKKWITGLSRRGVFDLLDFTFTKQGFVKGEKLFAKHLDLTGNENIEEFEIPFTAVATDMRHHEEVLFRSGDLYKALRASVSMPGFFVPVVEDGKVLVDGGVLNPLPINLVKKEKGAIIVAVNLNGRPDPKYDKKPEPDKLEEMQKWFGKMLPDSMKSNRKTKAKAELSAVEESFSLIELMDSSFSFTQDRLTELIIEMHKPDKLIEIPRNACGVFDFDQGKRVYDIGREAFVKAFG
ncbi:MAG TPA: patatin-like phospholipase family protein [Gracilimonas sp.]|uniref:patatin-like phospholipase family protein n=1 Tax=Gracilimonas sp. TaxID=1974203 RepID=UPI002DB02109|nr:patatin-like phospholipase family protein [Gracilimonas sp.]